MEWVAISFSNAWKWKVKVKSLRCVRLLATPWTAACQVPPSLGFSRQEYWSGVPLPSLEQTRQPKNKPTHLGLINLQQWRQECIEKLIEDNTGKAFWHKLYQCFLRSQGSRNRNKNKQMGPNQTYKHCQSKENHKQNEKTYRMRRTYLQTMQPTRAQFPKYTNNSYNSITQKKQTTQSKNRQNT